MKKVILVEVSNKKIKHVELTQGYLKISEKFEFYFGDRVITSSLIMEVVNFTNEIFQIKTKNSYYVFKKLEN